MHKESSFFMQRDNKKSFGLPEVERVRNKKKLKDLIGEYIECVVQYNLIRRREGNVMLKIYK